MSDGLDQQHQARDHRGRWKKGCSSPNPAGRPRGSKNQTRRRKAEPERAAEWTPHDWRVFYQRSFQEAEGGPGEKRGAAFAECTALWLLLNPAPQQTGLCSYCSKPLDVPLSSVSGAPIRVDGTWVHWGCMPWFCRARWENAKVALQRLGFTGDAF
jgi:hypothetical protein